MTLLFRSFLLPVALFGTLLCPCANLVKTSTFMHWKRTVSILIYEANHEVAKSCIFRWHITVAFGSGSLGQIFAELRLGTHGEIYNNIWHQALELEELAIGWSTTSTGHCTFCILFCLSLREMKAWLLHTKKFRKIHWPVANCQKYCQCNYSIDFLLQATFFQVGGFLLWWMLSQIFK